MHLVSQFTLYGKMKKGNKPDFHDAASPDTARKLYDHFYAKMCDGYQPDRVKNGVFQAMMEVELKNDGPVGVDYCSEDAAVHFAFLAPFRAATYPILTGLNYRLPSTSTPTSPKRNPRSRKTRRSQMSMRLRAHMSSKFQLSYYNEKNRAIDITDRIICTYIDRYPNVIYSW